MRPPPPRSTLFPYTTLFRSLERVESSNVFIDYAHTPDALENVLRTVKNVTTGRVIAVFGVVGDRDKTKWFELGLISEEYSHIPIVHLYISHNQNSNENIID